MIRKAQNGDAPVLAAVSMEVWLHTYLREGVTPHFADYVLSEFTARKFQDTINDPHVAIWVSYDETGIDGFVTVCSAATAPIAGCSQIEITTLYVRPRQQACGKGAVLLKRALEHCSSIGGRNAWLTVNAENIRAIDFYLRHGFHKIGSTYFRIADQAYENHVLRIDLPLRAS